MKINELISLSIGKISAGFQTDESAIKPDQVKKLLILGRPIVIPEIFKKEHRRVHSIWMQQFFPVYDERKQEHRNYTVFDVPETIVLTTVQNSVRYIGALDCPEAFRVVYSTGEMATMMNSEVMSPNNGRDVFALFEHKVLKIWNRGNVRIEKPEMHAIFKNPYDVPMWNPDLDDFPLDEKGAELLIEYVYKNYMLETLKTPANVISNSQEDAQLPQNKGK